MALRRLLLTLIVVTLARVASAQVFPIALPSHVIVDSCAGCGGPVTLPEVTGEAGSSLSTALTIQGTAAGVPIPVTFGALGVDINDGDGDHIAITSFAPTTENGLVVRNIPSGTQHIVCDSGCGSPPATADNSAFTFGTTSVSPIGAVVDDTATNTVTENSFGAPRMSTNRVLYVDLKQTQANTTAIKVDGSAVTQPVSGTFWQATQPVSGTFWQATQPVSGTVTTTPPANASTNVAQLAGTTTDTNSGTKSAGTLRVVLATDQPALTNKLLVTPDSVALPANQSVNVNQLAGTTTDTNSGVKSAGTLRVVLATDQPQLTNKLLVTPDANSAVNVAQFGGTNVVTGTGAAGSGIPRVTISNDSSLAANQSVNVNQIGGSAVSTAATGVQKVGLVGNAGAAIDAANNAAAPANVIAVGVEARSSTPTAATNGNLIRSAGDLAGNQFTVLPIAWTCNLQALAASLTQCQAAPSAGYSLYVTAILATTTTTTAGTFAVRYGTGSNCATTPIGVWPQPGGSAPSRVTTAPISTAAPMVINLGPVGIKVAAANALCVIGTATNTIDIVLSGYTAP